MKRRSISTIISLIILFCIACFTKDSIAKGIEYIQVNPGQYIIGKTQKVTIIGKGFSNIESIEITPSEGIEISQLKQVEREDGKEKWSIVIVVKKNATIGERTLIINTPEGKSDPNTIRIIPYAPEIKELKILSTNQEDCEVIMSLLVYYEAKELTRDTSKTRISFLCGADGGKYTAIESSGPPKEITKKDKGWYEIKDSFRQYSSSCSGVCRLKITLEDENGYTSNSLTTAVDFGTEKNK